MAIRWLDGITFLGRTVKCMTFSWLPTYHEATEYTDSYLKGEYDGQISQYVTTEYTNIPKSTLISAGEVFVDANVEFPVLNVDHDFELANGDYIVRFRNNRADLTSTGLIHKPNTGNGDGGLSFEWFGNYGISQKKNIYLACAVDDDHRRAILYVLAYRDDTQEFQNRIFGGSFTTYDNRSQNSYPQRYMYIAITMNEWVEPSPDEFYFYNHSKKVNSTKQPTGGTKIEGHFREPFNVLSPVLHIEAPNEFPYNYCKWHDSANNLDRYYWIRNKGWMPNNIVEITLEEDILATFKASIGTTSAFIKRSASNFNPLITDNAWITQNGAEILNETPIAGSPFDIANGFYVVGIMQKDQGSANSARIARKGGVDYFACKEAELDDLIGFLADLGATGVWGDYRPIDRVVFLRFFPFNAGTPSSGIYQCTLFQHTPYGQSETEFTWELHKYSGITGEIVSGTCSITFSDHPQASTDRTYLNYLPYTELALKAGPFGKIDLSKNLLDKDALTNAIDCTVIADLISGLSVLLIYSGLKVIYYTEDYSCSIDIAISQEFVNRYSDIQQRDFNKLNAQIEKTVTAVAAGAAIGGGILTENPLAIATGITLAVTAVATEDRGNRQYEIDSYNMAIPQLSCRGTNGTWFKISENWKLITTYHLIAGDSPATLGRPKQDYDLIGNCSGYVICNAASFEDSNAMVTETIQINDFLNRGFYYE